MRKDNRKKMKEVKGLMQDCMVYVGKSREREIEELEKAFSEENEKVKVTKN